MKLKILCLFLLLVLVLVSSCSKEEPGPPITKENTFSCKVNGKLFVPKDHGSFSGTIWGILNRLKDSTNWTFVLSNHDVLYIYLVDVRETGKYNIGKSDGDSDFFNDTLNAVEFHFNSSKSGDTFVSTSTSGDIEILELDVGKRIVFQFDRLELQGKNDPNKRLVLSEGKLNINRETLNKEE